MRHLRQGEGVSFAFPFPSFVRRGEGEGTKTVAQKNPEHKVVHA